MTTGENSEQVDAITRAERLRTNVARIEELSTRLAAALARRKVHDPALNGPGADIYMKVAASCLAEIMQNPARMLERQANYWGQTLAHYIEAQQLLLKGGEGEADGAAPAPDRRFSNPLWDTHPFFNYLKRQYQLNSDAMMSVVNEMDTLSDEDRKRVEYFTRQVVNLFSPTNFLGTNPDALERAVETDGESLVQGLENLVRDLEANDGEMIITLSDPDAFKVGGNLATANGSVVYRNRMMELIQYAPTTPTVHRIPLLIFPPWINKFYILDLRERNSLIRWIVDQGYTLFVVSWVNPDASFIDVGIDDYITEGFLQAIAEVKAITGEPRINVVGYCIGGTVLALTLAHMAKADDKSVRTATFFTTLTDFADPGEMNVFLTDTFLDGIQRQIAQDGVMSRIYMQKTFSFLRSNDLIYGPAIKSYMLGEPPPAFDLLYWNGDSTNLPGRMAIEYLRGLCQKNLFAEGDFTVLGEKVSPADVKVPLCAIACERDHIAPWKSSFSGIAALGSRSKTFILSESGHIAGIINPPTRKKYGHYTNDGPVKGAPDAWEEAATLNEGSWWPTWEKWLARSSGRQVDAREPGDKAHPVLGAAPGTYVAAEVPAVGSAEG